MSPSRGIVTCHEIYHRLTQEKRARNIWTVEWGASTTASLQAGELCVEMNLNHDSQIAGIPTFPRSLVFVVEDDEDIAGLISHTLRSAGFEVQSFRDGASVIGEALRLKPSLFLLDVILPGRDGFDICRLIRKTTALASTPIMFLTARTSVSDRVKGLELGADDYITKPFSLRELLARVRGLLRAARQAGLTDETLRVGDLEIDLSSMKINVQGQYVPATVREFRLLEYLATHLGRVLTRDQMLDAVWKETPFVTQRSIDVYVRRLREKIETDSKRPRYLKTIRGIGYRFESPRQ